MNKLLKFLPVCFVVLCHNINAQKLYGFVFEQNSGNKPVPGVIVKSLLANQTLTTDNGSYTLNFQNGKPGHSAILIIEKEKWVITEKSKLEVNLPLDPFNHPHTIIMCRADVWAKQNQDNKTLLNKLLNDALQKQKGALNKQSKDYQKTIDSLEEQYVKSQRNLGEITEALSSVNLDEVSGTEKAAYAYFTEGKIEEAILLRETLQSEKNLLIANQRLKELSDKSQINDSALASVHNSISLHRRNLKEEIILAQLRFDWKTAERKLKFLAENDSLNYENLFNYGDFLYNQNDFRKADIIFEKLISIYKTLSQANPNVFGSNLAGALYKSGAINKARYEFNNAAKLFQQSCNIYNNLYKKDSATFIQPLIKTTIAIADIHARLRLFSKAENEYQQAITVINQIKTANNNTYTSLLAEIQNGQAELSMYANDFTAAEKLLKEALNTQKKLDSINPSLSQELDISAIQTKLAAVYIQQKKFDAARVLLGRSLNLYEKFQQTSPSVFNPLVAEIQTYMGSVYMARADLGTYAVNKPDSTTAHNYFSHSLQSFRKLSIEAPEVYEPALANTCYNFGVFFNEALETDSAEALYTEAISLYEKFAGQNPAAFDIQLATAQQKLAKLYTLHNSESAKILLNKALAIYQKHAAAKENMEAEIAGVMFDIAVTNYYSRSVFSKEENERTLKQNLQQFKNLLTNYEVLDKKKPGTYQEDIQSIKTFIITVESEIKRVNETDPSIYTSTTDSARAAQELNGIMYDIQSATTLSNKLMLQQSLVTREKNYIKSGVFSDIISLGHDLNGLSWYLLFSKKYKDAEDAAKEALNPAFKKPVNYDMEIEYAKVNLAHALLLQNKYDDAKKIYTSLKGKNYVDGTSYVSMCLDDIDQLEKAGITHKDFEKIKILMVE
ncbi:MAG: tetratricopeptide repeat protein [Chitinophagaceae bacterium]|nr:tetratricopeptide repeat protein [Chitinophagaceae bacterium]